MPREVTENRFFCGFFANIFIGVSYGHNFLLTQRARLGAPFKYLEHVCKAYREDLETFEKKFQLKK